MAATVSALGAFLMNPMHGTGMLTSQHGQQCPIDPGNRFLNHLGISDDRLDQMGLF